jgi:hypothetical protein
MPLADSALAQKVEVCSNIDEVDAANQHMEVIDHWMIDFDRSIVHRHSCTTVTYVPLPRATPAGPVGG